MNAYERYSPACLGEQDWGIARLGHIPATRGWVFWVAAFPQGWFCRCYGCALPPSDATTGLQDSCCCWVWAGMAILRETQTFRNGHFWCPTAEHGLHKTLYNVLLPHNQPKPREQPLPQLGVPWRALMPEFPLSGLFSSITPSERAGLANMPSRKGDNGFEGHWPSLLVLVSCKEVGRKSWPLCFSVKPLRGFRNWDAWRRGTGTSRSPFHEKLSSFYWN